eukprot:CAMPEP_0170549452 /NCGR_PEP_ID=MMETSP0211-20121228/7612_1 /TAXON_ID=311385 /ORGANISM="Pseudokeronopsis sp., Strain OXSARD2" /LENGTH=59 /DNA_ID=CAMNT_0010855477 /DNA_START=537 /DNA_END=716 /DNA_ORIENTATION=+
MQVEEAKYEAYLDGFRDELYYKDPPQYGSWRTVIELIKKITEYSYHITVPVHVSMGKYD